MICALVQARMSSSRFYGKVMRPVLGVPMLQLELERISRARRIDKIVLVTSIEPEDDALVHLGAKTPRVDIFRGSLVFK